ncbi:hypothetical protein K0817_000810 [Microbacterium sp. HD4P20]|uniref:hypothetical protein n=1 Tax=Microbacterium sp. HD4P20 TaxID=2864874 RepID=UPI001C6404D1|nr:hypothetical protein [Microbacterium sp. HD4P20]MCP2635104.1 hypothetical protein [Microbacterium sp. HD4P20]
MTALTGFRILMPPGWSQYRVDEAGRARFMEKLSARMKQIGNPELDVRLRMLANAQWRRLEQTRTHSVYFPDREIDGLAHLPLSLAVRQHVAPSGTVFADGLGSLTTTAIETYDTATGPIQRWQSEKAGSDDMAGITTRAVGYGFAVPGADGRRGLVFLATIPYPDDADPVLVEGATELVDSIMETFRWR